MNAKRKLKVRKISLTMQIFVINIAVLLIATAVLGIVSTIRTKNAMQQQIRQRMLDIANSAAGSLDGDQLARVQTEADMGSPEYNDVFNKLAVFRDSVELEYIYCLAKTGPESFIFTIDPTIEDPAGFGDEATISDTMITAGNGEAAVDSVPYEDEWGRHYSAYSPVFTSGGQLAGIVAVDFSAAFIDQQIGSQIRVITLLSLAILILSVCVVLFLCSRINKGFRTLNDKICDIADGSGDLTKHIEMSSGDEFEVIAGNMNTFISQIRDIVAGVKSSVEGSVAASYELSVMADHASGTINSLSDAIAGVSRGATQQAEDVTGASGNVNDIVGRLSEVTDTIHGAEQYTDSMTANSAGVSESFDVLIDAIRSSMAELEQVTRQIGNVGDSVTQVIEAADVINEIADQTSLLSLNASIEAARAGEAGRGFAVVAEEIGKLAVQSNDSSVSIKQIMDELKGQTETTIELVSGLNQVMERQEATGMESRQFLGPLIDDIKNTKDSFDAIRVNVKGIQDACNELNTTIESLSAISQENAASAELTANSFEKISGIIGNVSGKSDDISRQSQGLGETVSMYRV